MKTKKSLSQRIIENKFEEYVEDGITCIKIPKKFLEENKNSPYHNRIKHFYLK